MKEYEKGSRGGVWPSSSFVFKAHHLMGHGLGYIDLHLLASARLSGLPLWTLDRPLKTAASHLNLVYGSL